MNNMSLSGFQNTTFGVNNTRVDESSGKIFSVDVYGNSTCIAYTVKAYTELKQLFEEAIKKSEEYKAKKDEYYDMLVKNGLIQKEFTTDEKLNILTQSVSQLAESVQQLSSDFSSIKGVIDELSGPASSGKSTISK